jgi:hypothetical protein
MSHRVVAWLAWSVWALTVPTTILTLFFASLNEPSSSLWDEALLPVLLLTFSTVGAFVASYRPENAIGWLFLSGAFVWIVGELTLEYGVYALITDPGALPAGVWAAWFGALARGLGWFVIVTFLLLLFPTDRRFCRRKYDARKALEAYSIKLRNETDLESLNNELVGVMRESMQPAHVSLWLHPATLPKSEESD